MNIKFRCIALILFFSVLTSLAQENPGAAIPWTTYEAEHMATNGTIMGPAYKPYLVETESSGQQCVKLNTKGQYVEFNAISSANSMVIRYSLPDSKDGKGLSSTIGIYKNGNLIQQVTVSSHYTWLYGKYPFTNDPSAGVPRHFYDEIRVKDLKIGKGDHIRIQRDDRTVDAAGYCIIDLVDLENIATPVKMPDNALSITDKSFRENDTTDDYTNAFRNCINKAVETGKTVWIPVGTYKITDNITLPPNIIVQGAGMWYTELVGDAELYKNANKRVRLIGNGSNIHLSDFAITGKLNYRSDQEDNDGITGSFGTNSTISNIWIEHTKVGMWIENSQNLKITGCRMRNTIADGINFCVGMSQSIIENCTARGTGDDCFAIWPTVFHKQMFSPGHNLIIHCTAQLPFLANGIAVYGGDSNQVKDCVCTDISQGSAILISTTFPTENKDKTVNNNFSGTTVIDSCYIKTSGGFDHEWDWRAAVELCVDKRNISGVSISNLIIENSLSNAISVIAKNEPDKVGELSNTTIKSVTVKSYGIGVNGKHGLFISADAHGSLTVIQSKVDGIKNESGNFTIVQ
ncbi:pectate lyase-like protein [Mucilaginibacter frigoritolerans]|uniref:Pectate lyase-like protein n=1 Tax=Mucilaginibacter frigoritolerans TaxID=652788 RepID=A0A562UFU3_9SPHI|nr:glycosyl hydrolase family 28-related protein [Mucilaginibacter frigoritolerans]TWJ04674.1 pectate lyase-like protein [Mucilaginibacter frigoritolerans]